MLSITRSHPLQLFGRHLNGATDTKALETTLKAIQTGTGDPGYNPGAIDGIADKSLVVAVIYGALKLGPKVPGMDKVWGEFNKFVDRIPLGGLILNLAKQRFAIEAGFDNLLDPNQQVAAMEWVEEKAKTLNTGYRAALAFLVKPATTPTAPAPIGPLATLFTVTQTAQFAPGGRDVFPEGSVAVRDTDAGVYRIFIKAP